MHSCRIALFRTANSKRAVSARESVTPTVGVILVEVEGLLQLIKTCASDALDNVKSFLLGVSDLGHDAMKSAKIDWKASSECH